MFIFAFSNEAALVPYGIELAGLQVIAGIA